MQVVEGEGAKRQAQETPGADFFMGIVLMILSVAVCHAAWSWPREGGFASSAALFPVGISSTLFLMALSLFVHSLRHKGYSQFLAFFRYTRFRTSWNEGNLKLALAALLAALIYMVIILSVLPFEIGTFLYLVGALLFFWKGKLYKILLISACIVAFYSLCFRLLFRLVLPGIEL
jgi:hypothetical protein